MTTKPVTPQAAEGLRERIEAQVRDVFADCDDGITVGAIMQAVEMHLPPNPAIAPAGEDAQQAFSTWFCLNYPGPYTIISDPNWHAPRIFRQAQWALRNALPAAGNTVDDATCAWCGYVQSANPLSHDPHCRVRTHPHEKAAALAAAQPTPTQAKLRAKAKGEAYPPGEQPVHGQS